MKVLLPVVELEV